MMKAIEKALARAARTLVVLEFLEKNDTFTVLTFPLPLESIPFAKNYSLWCTPTAPGYYRELTTLDAFGPYSHSNRLDSD